MSRFALLSVIILCCCASTADAQVRSTTAEQKDSAQVEAISIADLEMILPEKKLMPEVKKEVAETGYVESPFSSPPQQRAAKPEAKLTAKDIEMLQNIRPSQQATEEPSR
jgi:hypothetical protein